MVYPLGDKSLRLEFAQQQRAVAPGQAVVLYQGDVVVAGGYYYSGAEIGAKMIYLDYAANTPVNEEVLATFCKAARQYQGNANSKHNAGLAAKAEMERITISVA